MFQNYLFVAVKKELATSITHVETFQAEQGIANVWGNKGGTVRPCAQHPVREMMPGRVIPSRVLYAQPIRV